MAQESDQGRQFDIHRPPTLDDVARVAGVCRATCIRALHDRKHVSEATLLRVQAAVLQLGYVTPLRRPAVKKAKAAGSVPRQQPSEVAALRLAIARQNEQLRTLRRRVHELERLIEPLGSLSGAFIARAGLFAAARSAS